MSNYIDRYKRRVGRSGNNTGEAYKNNTIAFIDSSFEASPTFRVMKVHSVEYPDIKEIDARVVDVERMGTLREVLFRPQQFLNVGTYLEFDNSVWIISDTWGDDSFLSRALVQKCNDTIRIALSDNWKNEDGTIDTTKVFETYCISSQSPLGSKATQGRHDIGFNQYDVMLPQAQLFVYFERSQYTDAIELNDRFIFGKNVYEVYGIDDVSFVDASGHGIIQITMKVTTKRETDDFVNRIASNNINSEIEEDTNDENIENGNEENNEDKGGSIW